MFSVKQYAIRDYLNGNGLPLKDKKTLTYDAALLRNEGLTIEELYRIWGRGYGLFIASKSRSQEEKILLLQDFVSLGGVLEDILDSEDPIDLPAISTLKDLLSMGCIEYIRYLSDVNKSEREDSRIR